MQKVLVDEIRFSLVEANCCLIVIKITKIYVIRILGIK